MNKLDKSPALSLPKSNDNSPSLKKDWDTIKNDEKKRKETIISYKIIRMKNETRYFSEILDDLSREYSRQNRKRMMDYLTIFDKYIKSMEHLREISEEISMDEFLNRVDTIDRTFRTSIDIVNL